jgi:hypothetical protein
MMADENLEAELTSALRRRLEVIGDRALRATDPQRQLAELRAVSERIAALQERLPATVHPQLRHFFERCSYDKALEWIEREGLTGSLR